jgi:lipoprotein-anchoring transpeptidase ErfK/SrfK
MASGRYRLAALLAVLIVAGTTAAGWHGFGSARTATGRAADHAAGATAKAAPTVTARATSPSLTDQETRPLAALALASASPHVTPSPTAPATPVLSPAARKSCPAAATACVDLADHLTWLQSHGRISYGPIAMEPGTPRTSDATPRGTFHVTWKAGPNYMSNEYNEPMPWAVFFINGVAFHGGSLTKHSHGCVHLAIGSARYYHDHLPIGAEVVVFLPAAHAAIDDIARGME